MKKLEKKIEKFCKKNNLDVLKQGLNQDGKMVYSFFEKDIWDNVDFIEWAKPDCKFFIYGKIYRLFTSRSNQYAISETGAQHSLSVDFYKKNFNQSNEEKYKEQLEKIAHEKFGEIKVGDVFHREFSEEEKTIMVTNEFPEEFNYWKDHDALTFGGIGIYSNGKWAEKIQKIRVQPFSFNVRGGMARFEFKIIGTHSNAEIEETMEFLAKALENHLNEL